MKLSIAGIGIWSRGFQNWDEFQTVSGKLTADTATWEMPSATQIPGRERRRAPALVRLAVEVAHQACDMGDIRKSGVASVFCSAMGDSEIATYICQTLASPIKVLSPTKFHNSVHNAPAGYWSISAENRAPSSSVAASRYSFPVALLEASVLATAESRPVLLVAADIQVRGPYEGVYPIENPFGAGILIQNQVNDAGGWSFKLEQRSGNVEWPTLKNPFLQELTETNPAARCLRLIEAIGLQERTTIEWPLNESTHLHLESLPPDT
ncbi:MAG: beta-ketoacyl synthase chain length factor [Gammaproteobacteria bacterium]|nr:beta-ketoacyl synthase chain length factor [Gammaproteobacteria bacterium]